MSAPLENPAAKKEVLVWQRQQLLTKLEDEGAEDLAKHLRQCGVEMKLICTCCGHGTKGEHACKKRWCPTCQRQIAAKRLKRFAQGARSMQWPLSIMLSHENEDNAEDVFKTLMPAFKRFRRTQLWKRNVTGGLVSYEVTNRFGSWHDHLHVLCDCRWLAIKTPEPKKGIDRKTLRRRLTAAKHELTEAWAECLGQETAITWVDRAFGHALIEHIKYTIKGSDLLATDQPIAPLIRALKGRRLVQPFGNLYGLGKEWKDEEDADEGRPCEQCQRKGSMLPEHIINLDFGAMRKGKAGTVFYRKTKHD